MDPQPTAAEPTMYCKRCRYPLNHLATASCPECGRAFDPKNPKTYAKTARRKFSRRLIGLILVGAVATLLAWGYAWDPDLFRLGPRVVSDYFAWQSERQSVQVIIAGGGLAGIDSSFYRGKIKWLSKFHGEHLPVTSVTFGNQAEWDAGYTAVASLSRLHELRIRNTSISDVQGAALVRSRSRWLDIDRGEFSARALAGLSQAPNLTDITIYNSAVSESDLIYLGACGNLVTLRFDSCTLERRSLRHLTGTKNLRYLSFKKTNVSDEDLADFAGFARSDGTIFLLETAVTNVGMARLARAPNVGEIWLDGKGVDAGGLTALAASKSLKRVYTTNPDAAAELKRKRPEIRVTPCVRREYEY